LSDNGITLPSNAQNDNFIQKMLRNFNGNNLPSLNFSISPSLPYGEYAITNGLGNNSYEIITSQNVEN
jgi:hypothetical protein